MSEEIADVMASARERVANGWVTDSYFSYGKVCAVGGILIALSLMDEQGYIRPEMLDNPQVDAACKALVKVIPEDQELHPKTGPVDVVIHWNDNHAENSQAVQDAFAKAEKIQRAGFDPDEGIGL